MGTRRTIASTWLALLTLAAPVPGLAQSPKVERGEISDTRATAHQMGSLSVELKLAGENLEAITAARVRLKTAKDDKGNVLLLKKDAPPDFEEWAPNRSPGLKVQLLNPARGASTVDLAGEVDAFVPSRDPASTVKLERFLAKLDKPFSSSALKSAGVEVTPLSAPVFVERRKKAAPTKEQMIAEGRKHGASEEEIKQGLALMEAFSSLAEAPPGETSVLFEVKDPDRRVLAMDVVGSDGNALDRQGRGSSGRELSYVELTLREKPPEGAALKVTLRTNKGTIVVPFSMKQEVLPTRRPLVLCALVAALAALAAASPSAAAGKPAKKAAPAPKAAPRPALPPPEILVGMQQLVESRSAGPFAGTNLSLSLAGKDVMEIKAARAVAKKATDDLGNDLLASAPKIGGADDFAPARGAEPPRVAVDFGVAPRKASKVTVAGTLEVYLPGRDPAAQVDVADVLKKRDRPLAVPALKALQVELTVCTKAGLEAAKAKADAEEKAKKAKAKAKSKKSAEDGLGEMMESLGSALGSMIENLLYSVSDNDVALRVKDPGGKVFSFEVIGPDGKPLEIYGVLGGDREFRVVKMAGPVPDGSSLRVHLKSPAALVEIPFRLEDVVLP